MSPGESSSPPTRSTSETSISSSRLRLFTRGASFHPGNVVAAEVHFAVTSGEPGEEHHVVSSRCPIQGTWLPKNFERGRSNQRLRATEIGRPIVRRRIPRGFVALTCSRNVGRRKYRLPAPGIGRPIVRRPLFRPRVVPPVMSYGASFQGTWLPQ